MLHLNRSIHTRQACTLTTLSVVVALLSSPLDLEAQETITLDFAAYGAATEENPDDPDHPNTILFIGQPAVFEMTITNHGEQEQIVSFGGGGAGGFIIENAAVLPEEAGECEIGADQLFVDCPALTVPGTGSGKSLNFHNSIRLIWDIDAQSVSSGGITAFAGNSEAGMPTVGASVEVQELERTHTLTVQSHPPGVRLTHTPSIEGDSDGVSEFTRTYAEGAWVRVTAPRFLQGQGDEANFYRWEGGFPLISTDDTTALIENAREVWAEGVMDEDRTVTAQYVTKTAVVNFVTGQEAVDIYANGMRQFDNLQQEMATPFLDGPTGGIYDVTVQNAPDNSSPLMSFPFDGQGSPTIIGLDDSGPYINYAARIASRDSNMTDLTLLVPVAPEVINGIRVVIKTPAGETEILGPTKPPAQNGFTDYVSFPPGPSIINVSDPDDGTVFEAIRIDLETGAMLGVLRENGDGKRQGFSLHVFDADGQAVETTVVTSAGDGPDVPSSFALHGNYPNPFNPETVIRFEVPELSHVRLEILNVLGQVVETLIDSERLAGSYRAVFEAGDIPSGTYFYRMTAGSFKETRPMVLQR